ncbi:MAG: hypothetical protein IT208_15020 [Chthonomonadales bacterium]|nr:hypothetical protein [Chthonomonadales bacterium]
MADSGSNLSRRRLLGTGVLGMAASLGGARRAGAESAAGEGGSAMGIQAAARGAAGWRDVTDFGAKGDGQADETAAFQRALDDLGKSGGGEVYAPPGRYLFRGSLNVPVATSLVGSFQAVPAHNGIRDANTPKPGDDGTTLFVTGGAGSEDGPPFITLNTDATLKGVVVYYPDQDPKARPKPYPWTVAMRGKNPAVLDTELLNPYNGIDTSTSERHLIRCVHGQPLRRGILVDQIYDIGRIEDVHWNPWWSMSDPVMKLMREEGEGFILAKTDWEYMVNCFCIMYSVGFRFTKLAHGPGNTVLTQCGSDVGPLAVLVEDCQAHAGIAFTNGQFMAGVRVAESNSGPVKFSNCGFWPIETTDWHADLAGAGNVSFNGCHFSDWAIATAGTPCIRARCSGVTVMGCDFMAPGKPQIEIDAAVKSAVVVGNRLRGGERITNRAEGAQIGLNTTA